jgi:hypothetical protein
MTGIRLPESFAQQFPGAAPPPPPPGQQAAAPAPAPQAQAEYKGPTPNEFMESATKLDAAIQQAPDIGRWPAEQVEAYRDDARKIIRFLMGGARANRQLDEDQKRIYRAAREIL